MGEESKRLIGHLLASGTSKEQWIQLAGSTWDSEHEKLQQHALATPASAASIPTPPAVATPASTAKSETTQWACPRCTGKFGEPKTFPRKAELIRHIMHKCEQTIEILCSETSCSARLTSTDHLKEHMRKIHHLNPDEVSAKASTATILKLPQRAALGCGFCRAVFINTPEKYGEHIAAHFKHGSTVAEWSFTTQVLSLLYQSKDVYRAWVQVLVDRLPGVEQPEQFLKFTKETAASFIGILEKGLDAETL